MRTRDLKWGGLAALAVAASLAVVAAGALGAASGEPAEASPAAGEAPGIEVLGIEVLGAPGVAALAGDDGSFARALSAYLEAAGRQAGTATAVADPAEPHGSSFYVSAGGLWYACEATGGASGWAFSPLGAQSPFSPGEAGDHAAAGPDGGAQPPEGPGPADAAGQPDEGEPARSWVPLSDGGALASAVGGDAASQLAEAMAGYAAAKGIGFDAASARVDASSARPEPGGVGFEADTGYAMVDVVYAGGEYGFKVI